MDPWQQPSQLCNSLRAMPGKFLGIAGQDHSDFKTTRLHVDIFWFCFHSFEIYFSIDSSKMIRNSHEVSNFNWLVLKLNRLICNYTIYDI